MTLLELNNESLPILTLFFNNHIGCHYYIRLFELGFQKVTTSNVIIKRAYLLWGLWSQRLRGYGEHSLGFFTVMSDKTVRSADMRYFRSAHRAFPEIQIWV